MPCSKSSLSEFSGQICTIVAAASSSRWEGAGITILPILMPRDTSSASRVDLRIGHTFLSVALSDWLPNEAWWHEQICLVLDLFAQSRQRTVRKQARLSAKTPRGGVLSIARTKCQSREEWRLFPSSSAPRGALWSSDRMTRHLWGVGYKVYIAWGELLFVPVPIRCNLQFGNSRNATAQFANGMLTSVNWRSSGHISSELTLMKSTSTCCCFNFFQKWFRICVMDQKVTSRDNKTSADCDGHLVESQASLPTTLSFCEAFSISFETCRSRSTSVY